MDRRAFLTWVGVGWLASSLPVAIAACFSQVNRAESAPQKSGFRPVGTTAQLNKTGKILLKKSPFGPILVVRTASENKLIALDPICTHKGCVVEWLDSPKKFSCPCHGAEFGQGGEVLKGPARKPLGTYTAKIEGDLVLVNQS